MQEQWKDTSTLKRLADSANYCPGRVGWDNEDFAPARVAQHGEMARSALQRRGRRLARLHAWLSTVKWQVLSEKTLCVERLFGEPTSASASQQVAKFPV